MRSNVALSTRAEQKEFRYLPPTSVKLVESAQWGDFPRGHSHYSESYQPAEDHGTNGAEQLRRDTRLEGSYLV